MDDRLSALDDDTASRLLTTIAAPRLRHSASAPPELTVPMSASTRSEILRDFPPPPPDDPTRYERQQAVIEYLLDKDPAVRMLIHQFTRRLGRALSADEQRTLIEQYLLIGPDRLSDVVLDLSSESLVAWLAARYAP